MKDFSLRLAILKKRSCKRRETAQSKDIFIVAKIIMYVQTV